MDRGEFWTFFDEFQSKAGCAHTRDRAVSLWLKIKNTIQEIDPKYITLIQVEWDHHGIGEGRYKLDSVCNEFRDKYKV